MLQTNFTPFPELITERLLLRRAALADSKEVLFLRSDPDVLKYIGREPIKTLKEAEDFILRIDNDINNNDAISWAIALKDNPGCMIGTIGFWRMQKDCFRAEIGYVLNPVFWRKGIMKEAIKKVLSYGFNVIGLHSAEARISPENEGSAAVLESSGFIKEGCLKESFFFRDKFEDTVIYSKLKSSQ